MGRAFALANVSVTDAAAANKRCMSLAWSLCDQVWGEYVELWEGCVLGTKSYG